MTDSNPGRTGTREFDLILFGATGFTGRLVAEYLVKKRPSLRWALAGRSIGRLERVRNELAALEPSLKELPLLTANSLDRAAMDRLVRRTRVLCTTAGPYARYGSALLGACAEQGTDYCDLTGETHWVREMIDTHHARAIETGARIVPSCGFDSIPSDLGVLLLHEALSARGGQLAEAHYRVLRMKGGASGGTIASGLHIAERMKDPAVRRVLADPYSLNPEGAPAGGGPGDSIKPRKDPETGRWLAPFFMAAVNTRVVRRSNALLDYAYGREFRYDEAIDVGGGPLGMFRAATTSLGMAMSGAIAFKPVRALASSFLPAPGEGPSREQRENGFFEIELLGVGTAGERVRARVGAKQDPGYGATSWMMGESALCLALDELPRRGGLLTPASCMGMKLVERLRAAGMTFEVEVARG